MILYRFVRTLIAVIIRALWRTSFEGLDNVPRDQPFVLAPVHRSFIDFALVSGVTKRRLRYMGKDSLWKYRLFGNFISALGAYPVRRGAADREAMRRTITVIENGEPVVLFPEGTRRSGPVVENLFEGAAYVAARTGVPLVPVGIGGSEEALRKGRKLPRLVKIHVVVGPPIAPPERTGTKRLSLKAVHEVTVQLQGEIQRLFDYAQLVAGTK